jgi:hypothetical protein
VKLQYLGDARDAFKWDLLHWICTTSRFSNLVFVPLLTPDEEGSTEGQTLHQQFACKGFIRPFLDSLKLAPRSLAKIAGLGEAHSESSFPVTVFAPDRIIGTGSLRASYWNDFEACSHVNSIVFFDPDNGYETKTRRGPKWIRHDELKAVLGELPESSVALVYQHKPHRKWRDLFDDLREELRYAHTAVAVHDSTLAFVGMAKDAVAGKDLVESMREYSARHPDVDFVSLFEGG